MDKIYFAKIREDAIIPTKQEDNFVDEVMSQIK